MLIDLSVTLINYYQKKISPKLNKKGIYCKYIPTCSEYTKISILKYGLIIGVIKGFFRILRCNHFSKGGFDPVK